MIVELQLPPHLEQQLQAEALELGLTLEDHVLSVIEKQVISLGLDEPMENLEPYL